MDRILELFIKNHNNVKDAGVRKQYGLLSGRLGIFFNIVLFIIKIAAGFISGSVAVMADAFNNLSDAGTSLVLLIGFKMSGKKPDPEHPFGHGRIEYITGLIISIVIILMGVELIKSSVEKIIKPTDVNFSTVTMVILIVSIAVKVFMYRYNKKFSEKIGSVAMKSVAMDSFSDSIATCCVLLSLMVSEYNGIKLDGWLGLLVSLFVVSAGYEAAKDTIDPLLGEAPDEDFVNNITRFVASYDDILGMHDLIVHDYGPGRMMLSFHAEVPADGDFVKLHDTVDNIERKLKETLGCETVIHMDPVFVNDEATNKMRKYAEYIVKGISEDLTMHDFRMASGPTHTKLIFDVVVPYDFNMTDDEVKEEISKRISILPGNLFAQVDVDKPMIKKQSKKSSK
ncbi:MAG: cation diffusion facilitator family transporter [Lachnospiraceae bacterium]|nr:cation diffusion facilitator family transporter [Lachnospiraceae bacterium]